MSALAAAAECFSCSRWFLLDVALVAILLGCIGGGGMHIFLRERDRRANGGTRDRRDHVGPWEF